MSTTTVNARIDTKSKEQAQGIFTQLGLSMSGAIEIFFKQVILHRGLPFNVRLPSKGTIKAINELESGKGISFDSVEELFEDLDS
jgi:DNA-damage-inducible protein J